MNKDRIKLEFIESPNYPLKIKENVKDCKPIFHLGDLDLVNRPAVGIVGSRRCTRYGMTVTKEIAKRAAARGIVVVSGLARGIDSVAHRTCLEEGGKTIGVVGGGIDVVYPRENADLYEEIGRSGLLISEYPPGSPIYKWNFPTRNRLISALSDAVVIVEAGTRSGSLITAEAAIEQGKEVFAVPGNITNVYSMGPNKLIRDGSRALVIIDDLFTAIREISDGRQQGQESEDFDGRGYSNSLLNSLGEDEKAIFQLILGSGEVPIGEVYQKMAMNQDIYPPLGIPEINGIISILEMKGLVYCEMGKVMVANFT